MEAVFVIFTVGNEDVCILNELQLPSILTGTS